MTVAVKVMLLPIFEEPVEVVKATVGVDCTTLEAFDAVGLTVGGR